MMLSSSQGLSLANMDSSLDANLENVLASLCLPLSFDPFCSTKASRWPPLKLSHPAAFYGERASFSMSACYFIVTPKTIIPSSHCAFNP